MKNIILLAGLLFTVCLSIPVTACDSDPGCTCVPMHTLLSPDAYFYMVGPAVQGGNNYYTCQTTYGDTDLTVVGQSIDISQHDLPARVEIIMRFEKSFIVFRDAGVTYLDCGSDACTHPEQYKEAGTTTVLDTNNNKTYTNLTFTFRVVASQTVQLEKVINNDNGEILYQTTVNPLDDPIPSMNVYLTPSSPLTFTPHYAANTTEARLEYKITGSSDAYATAITVTNPQYYGTQSYVFGRTPLKAISLDNVNLTIRAYFTNGINEYYTSEVTYDFKQQKGLK